MAGIGGFMPRSRSRGGWQMRGGRCVANSSRPASGAMEAASGEQGMFTNNWLAVHFVHLNCLLIYVPPLAC